MTATARKWVEVAPQVRVTHSRLDHTSSIVVGRAGTSEVLLVDPAWAPDELNALAADLQTWEVQVSDGFATHAHHDHVLWHPGFGPAPRWASPGAAALANAEAATNRDFLRASSLHWPQALLDLAGQVQPVLDPQELPGWAELIVHDGHSTGHTALWLPGPRVLIAGDMLSDVEIPLLHETGLDAYAEGMAALYPFVRQAEALIPGHGRPSTDPLARWTADRRYLDAVHAGIEPEDGRVQDEVNATAHDQNVAAAAR